MAPPPPAKLTAGCDAVVGPSPLVGFVGATAPSGAAAGVAAAAAATGRGAVRLVRDVMLLAADAMERLSCGVATLASDMTMPGRGWCSGDLIKRGSLGRMVNFLFVNVCVFDFGQEQYHP